MEYKLLEVVGRGKFGTVHKARRARDNAVVAVKILSLDTDSEEVKDIQGEVALLSHLRGAPNIPHYHEALVYGRQLWVVMDFCSGGSIRTLLKPGPLDEKYIGIIARELFVALEFIHENNVIHRDIKAANILISKEGSVRLCDFGVAAKLTNSVLKRTTMAGTPYWMAPEVITEGATYNYKADVWSAGITIYEMATGNPPYSDKDAMRAMQLLTQHEPPRLEGRQYSTFLKDVIALCLEENPNVRPSAEGVLKCKFIKTHKHLSTSNLKEIVGRYLVWRDNNNKDKAEYEQSTEVYNLDEGISENYDIKWDFDSLKSAEYIFDNEIQLDSYIPAASNMDFVSHDHLNSDFTSTFTMNNTIVGTIGDTRTQTQQHVQTARTNTTQTKSTADTTSSASVLKKGGPKSLLNLFEIGSPLTEQASSQSLPVQIEEPELEEENERPSDHLMMLNTAETSNNEPIEIPDMSKPISLLSRSRSATVSLDVLPVRRPPVPTSISQSTTPVLYTNPSPIPISDSSKLTLDMRSEMKQDSPIKSPTHMKPLQSTSSQPLLQPLNQQQQQKQLAQQVPSAVTTSQPRFTPPSSAQTVTSASTLTAFDDPQVPIAMPVPSSKRETITQQAPNMIPRPALHLNLNGINSPINQFGIDGNQNPGTLSMTPVTEFPMMTNTITPEGISHNSGIHNDEHVDMVGSSMTSNDDIGATISNGDGDHMSISSSGSLPLLMSGSSKLANVEFKFGSGSNSQSVEPLEPFEANDTLTEDTTFDETTFASGANEGPMSANILDDNLDPFFVHNSIGEYGGNQIITGSGNENDDNITVDGYDSYVSGTDGDSSYFLGDDHEEYGEQGTFFDEEYDENAFDLDDLSSGSIGSDEVVDYDDLDDDDSNEAELGDGYHEKQEPLTIEDEFIDAINETRENMAQLIETEFQSNSNDEMDALYLNGINDLLDKISLVVELTSDCIIPVPESESTSSQEEESPENEIEKEERNKEEEREKADGIHNKVALFNGVGLTETKNDTDVAIEA